MLYENPLKVEGSLLLREILSQNNLMKDYRLLKNFLKINDNENSTVINIDLKYIAMKEKECQTLFVGDESDYRKTNKKEMGEFSKKLVELPISKNLQKIDENDLLFLFDFNKLYRSTQADKDSTWPAIEVAYLFRKINERLSL